MDSKQVAFTLKDNECFYLAFSNTSNSRAQEDPPKNTVCFRLKHEVPEDVKINVININMKLNQRLSNVTFSRMDGRKEKIIDFMNAPYFAKQKALEDADIQNRNSETICENLNLLLQESHVMWNNFHNLFFIVAKMPNVVKSKFYLREKTYLEPLLYVTSEKEITPFYNIEGGTESVNESEDYTAYDVDFNFDSNFDITEYITKQLSLCFRYDMTVEAKDGIYFGKLCIGNNFSAECKSVAYQHCKSSCGTAALYNLKQWLPNLRWYKCQLPNRRRKTWLLNQFSKNYNGAQKKGICKLIYKKNKNVYSLESILKMHKVNFTKTVSKGNLEVHIGRYKVERNGFILIAEAVQRTQRDALELSAFTAIEFLCYSNIFQDISNVIRTSLFKADPSV
ncbi:hypothetical protein T12_16056 [Trichinella patagoniensis]|uniref:Uncharacterized protein n=1 Tax=Trichinella patagoniensis TaxID=990121 RepID=A0A0V1AA48_9BILA|nr:hypothetical protein T12_16056 [Trichinella patagoniensis]